VREAAAVALPVWLLAAACGGGSPERPAAGPPPATAPPAPRILQFYAAPGLVTPGDRALLCYGVEFAASVRLEPPVREIRPAITRCIPVNPRRTTTYTLVATGESGETVSRSVEVSVQATAAPARPRPEPERPGVPRVLSFTAEPEEVARGGLSTLCFQSENGRAELLPPVQALGQTTRGCFAVSPTATTTYILIVTSPDGRTARAARTVTVR